MYHKLVKNEYFNKLLTTTRFDGSSFNFLPEKFHDPTLDFMTRLHRYTSEQGETLNLNNVPWIAILWTRSPVGEATIQTQYKKKQFVIFNGNNTTPEYNCYKFRLCAVKMACVFYSNDPDYLEEFEESAFLDIPYNFPLPVIYPNIHATKAFTAQITNHQHTSVIKEPRDNSGTLSKLQTECVFNYVIPKFETIIKGVKEIDVSIVQDINQTTSDFDLIILK